MKDQNSLTTLMMPCRTFFSIWIIVVGRSVKRASYQIYAKIRLEIARVLFDISILTRWKDWPKYLTYWSLRKEKKPSGTILKFLCFSNIFFLLGVEGGGDGRSNFFAFSIRLFSKLHSYQSGLCSGSKLWTKLTLNN